MTTTTADTSVPPQTGATHLPANLAKETVLVPGAHVTADDTYREVGTDEFADLILLALGFDKVWRRAKLGGELIGPPGQRIFQPLTKTRARLLIDENLRLAKWVKSKTTHHEVYVPATGDHGELLSAKSVDSDAVRDIEVLTNFPVCLPDSFLPASRGHNADGDIYYDEPPALRSFRPITDRREIHSILSDLVVDFPFASQADRENLYGLLLTPILRPAIKGNVPLHLATAPIERSGKTKLVEQVVGRIILGEPTPQLQMTGSEDERDKRVLAHLLSGRAIAFLDNLHEYLDSAVLASLLTATTWHGRLLGVSQMLTIRNRTTLIASGNNVRASSEISKRTIPINLLPAEQRPDNRTQFQHPDIERYLDTQRPAVLGALMGMVENWRVAGRPHCHATLGGFEDWSHVVGGILATNGYELWLANREQFIDVADDFGAELERFVEAWASTPELDDVPGLTALAVQLNCFADALLHSGKSERAIQTIFGRRVLSRATGRVVGEYRIESKRTSKGRRYLLSKIATAASPAAGAVANAARNGRAPDGDNLPGTTGI